MGPMPPRVVVYTTAWCGYCFRAKRLLKQRGIAFEEIDLSSDREKLAQLKLTNAWRTVPQIFVDGEFIGGADELYAIDRSGELARRLAATENA